METATNPQTGQKLYLDDQGGWQPLETATNPKTGQKAMLKNGKWEPLDRRQAEPEPADAPWQEDVKGFIREVGSGATFGLSDNLADITQEAENYWRDKLGMAPSENTKSSHELRTQFREQHPNISMGATIGGALVNPVNRAVGNWSMAGKLPAQMLKGSAAGAGLGATQAIGESAGPMSERLQAGADAAKMGAVFGPLAPAVVKAGSNVFGGIGNKLAAYGSPEMQLSQASRLMAKALKDDGYTVKTALAKLKELGPSSTLADLGDSTRSVLRAVYDRGGIGAQKVAKFFGKRQGGEMIQEGKGAGLQTGHAAGRVEGMIDDLGFGKYHDKTALEKMQKEATKLYDDAYAANQVVDDTTINSLLNREGMGEVMEKARQGMRLRGQSVSKYSPDATSQHIAEGGTGKMGEGLKLKYLDKIKRVLYDMEEGERDSITGRLTDKGGAWQEIRRDLTKALDEADSTGLYAQARQKAGGKLASEQARRRGNNFISKSEFADEQVMADEIAEMSAHELQNFRIGVANALKAKVGAKKYKAGNAPDAIKGNDALERKIKVAFGDDDTFVTFKNQLLAEDELHKTYSKLGGTQTSKNVGSLEYAEAEQGRILEGLQNMALNRPVRGTIDVAMGIKDKLLMPKSMSGELADLLTSRNLTPIQEHYKAQIMSQARQGKLSQLLLQGGAGASGTLNAGR